MPLPVPNVRIYGAESPQFVDYGRSSAIRQESVPITATHRRLRAGVTVAPGSSGDDSMAALFPTFNLHRRETVNPLTLIENPDAVQRDLLEACVHVVESPNFVVFHDAVGDDIDNVIFPDLIALEAFFIVLQLEYGFDFTLPCLSYPPTLPPDHGYRKQLWHERRFPIFLRHGGDPGGGGWADIFFVVSRWACPVPAAAAATAMEAAVMTIFSMISLFFFHVQRTLPYWQFDADGKPRELPEHQRAEILHDATVKLAAIIVLQMLSTSRDAGVPPWVPKADSAPGTALAGVRNNMTRNFHKAWATHDKWIYWAMLVQEYGKPVLGRMHCDNSGERFMDTLVRLTGCAAHVDLMAFWCRQLLRHGYVYRRYRTIGDRDLSVEWYSTCHLKLAPGSWSIDVPGPRRNWHVFTVSAAAVGWDPPAPFDAQRVLPAPGATGAFYIEVPPHRRTWVGIACANEAMTKEDFDVKLTVAVRKLGGGPPAAAAADHEAQSESDSEAAAAEAAAAESDHADDNSNNSRGAGDDDAEDHADNDNDEGDHNSGRDDDDEDHADNGNDDDDDDDDNMSGCDDDDMDQRAESGKDDDDDDDNSYDLCESASN